MCDNTIKNLGARKALDTLAPSEALNYGTASKIY